MDRFFEVGIFDTKTNTNIITTVVRRPSWEDADTLKAFLDHKFATWLDESDIMVTEVASTRIYEEKCTSLVWYVNEIYNALCHYYKLEHTQIPGRIEKVKGKNIVAYTTQEILREPGLYEEIDKTLDKVVALRVVTGGDEPIIVDPENGIWQPIDEWLEFDTNVSDNYTYRQLRKF